MKILQTIKNKLLRAYMLNHVAEHKNELFIGNASKTRLSRFVHLGYNPNFNGMLVKGCGHVWFGDNFHSGQECLILTSNHNYDKGIAIPYDSTNINKDVVIEDNVWLGDRVIILGGVTIGEGAIIQAGAVVSSSIPAFAIAGGNPAKPFKKRDIEHYNRLKEQKKFH